MTTRDRLTWYSLEGGATDFAVAHGLSSADWYRTDIPRKRMKELMRRSDAPAIRDTIIWLGLILLSGAAIIGLWGSWWVAPFVLVYGVLYGSAGDSRWHEAGHGTAFRTRWMDQAVYQLACFFMMRNPVTWRYSHARHHSDTLVVGRDPEIVAMRPARLGRILLNLVGLVDVPQALLTMLRLSAGRLSRDERAYVPEQEHAAATRVARIWLVVYAAVIAIALVTTSWLPLVLVGGPRVYGCFMHVVYGLTQHSGMGENVIDHRLNTRTVLMGPINRFLYWNMNFHIEHHMYPMVPYHRLPELHEQMRHDTPEPYPGLVAAYREIIPAVLRQLRDPTYFVRRELPATAAPFHGPVDGLLPPTTPTTTTSAATAA